VVPFLVWVALRFGPRMVTLSGAIVTVVSAWGTAQQLLGFAINDITIAPTMDALGIFLIVTLITCYILTTVWEQNKIIQTALRESEGRYRKLIENQGEGVAIVDSDEIISFANPTANQIFGTDHLIGKSLREFTNSTQFAAIEQQTEQRRTGKKGSYELEIIQPGGKRCDLWVTATPEYDNRGEFCGAFAVFRDITERKQVEMALRDSRARFQTLFDHSPVPIWEEDFSRIKRFMSGLQRDGVQDFREFFAQHPEQVTACEQLIRVLDVNQAALQMLGFYDKNQFLTEMFNLFHRGPKDVFIEELVAIAEGKTDFETEGPNDLVDGVIRFHHVRWTVAPGYEKDYRRVIVTIIDITERKQVEERMRYLSTHDVLTGLYNRNLFEAELERMQDSRLEPINVMVVDVNGMKTTNDTYGHAAGDDLLRRTAQVLKTSFRKEDIIARIGGDEFVVLFHGTISTQDAVTRVKDCLIDHNHWYDGLPLSLAIGAASGAKGSSLVELFKKADYLMYRDKSRSRRARTEAKPGNSPQDA
jgi:diguanylate cyclase (GGDEF)-like protein/PAS domain S-box-containing protein